MEQKRPIVPSASTLMADLNGFPHTHRSSNRRTKLSSSHFQLGSCELCTHIRPLENGYNLFPHGHFSAYYERLFHDECTTCLPPESSSTPLCSFCNHLRLPHLFGCIVPKLKDPPPPRSETGISIEWGKGYKKLWGDQTCSLCALIGTTLRSRAKTIDKGDGNLSGGPIFVEFFVQDLGYSTQSPWKLRICRPPTYTQSKSIIATITMSMAKVRNGEVIYSDPPIGLDVNWDSVRQWMGVCHQHRCSRNKSIETMDKDFRLIDVGNNCLVKGSKAWPYAALSYVWGDFRAWEAQAVLANVSQLEQKGGLLVHELPRCILDAQTACKCLGIKFLWVDRLCIIQDDAKSKHRQIKEMGNIYASAVVTIVAAAGENARHGLIGVSKRRAFPQEKLVLQGVEFTETLDADHFSELMEKSMWRSRGWTFQEEKLSTALLVFTERGVFFRCKHNPDCIRMEGQSGEITWVDFNHLYSVVVVEYSQRKLSFESDILNAFSGYLSMMFNDKHYFGLPYAHFNSALLWRSADSSGLPRESNGNGTFPSWSWASTTGAVDYQSWLFPGDHEPVASWAAILFPPGSTNPQLLPVCEVPSKLPSLQKLLRKELPWHYLWKKSPWKTLVLKQRLLYPILHGELSRLWTTLLRQTKSYKEFWFQSRWLSMKHNLFPNVTTGLGPREVFRAGRLLAYTQIANISVTRLVWPTSFALRKDAPFVLRNKWGKWIGFVNPDKPTAEQIDSYSLRGETYSAECLALSLHRKENSTFPLLLDEDLDTIQDRAKEPGDDIESQYIFQKRSHRFWREMGCLGHQVSEAERQSHPFLFSTIDDPHSGYPPQLTVMMVERMEGVARRVGVGNVYLKRWTESAPSFQSVVLD